MFHRDKGIETLKLGWREMSRASDLGLRTIGDVEDARDSGKIASDDPINEAYNGWCEGELIRDFEVGGSGA